MSEEAIPGLRDFLATSALAVLSNPDHFRIYNVQGTAELCYQIADAMLIERNKGCKVPTKK